MRSAPCVVASGGDCDCHGDVKYVDGHRKELQLPTVSRRLYIVRGTPHLNDACFLSVSLH